MIKLDRATGQALANFAFFGFRGIPDQQADFFGLEEAGFLRAFGQQVDRLR